MTITKDVNEYCRTYGFNHNAGSQNFRKQLAAEDLWEIELHSKKFGET